MSEQVHVMAFGRPLTRREFRMVNRVNVKPAAHQNVSMLKIALAFKLSSSSWLKLCCPLGSVCVFILFICSGLCHLSSVKQCSGLIFFREKHVYFVVKKIFLSLYYYLINIVNINLIFCKFWVRIFSTKLQQSLNKDKMFLGFDTSVSLHPRLSESNCCFSGLTRTDTFQ